MDVKKIRNRALTENALEKMMGGYSQYCAFWNAFKDLDISVVVCDDGKAIAYALSALRVESVVFSCDSLLKSLVAGEIGTFALDVRNKMLKGTKRTIETYKQVNSQRAARVLWAFSTLNLGGDQDRLYDDCFENDDGEEVSSAIAYLNQNYRETTSGEWTLALANKALAATDTAQASLF